MNAPIRILYVDDYPLDRELVRDALVNETSGIELTEAASHSEFLELFQAGRFDLILSDFNIAGFNALQVLEIAARIDPGLPVIIVTGTGSEEAAVEAMKRGAADYVIKTPSHIRRLPRTIRAVLDQKRLELERRQAIEALRESEDRFRSIFENVAIGIYRTTPAGEILMANPALVKMLRFSSFEELAQRNLEEAAFQTSFPRAKFKRQLEEQGEIIGLESAWVRADGSILFVRENARAIRDDAGNILYYEGTVEDITERKEAEDAMRATLLKTEALYNVAKSLIAAPNLASLLHSLVESVASALPADRILLVRLDMAAGRLIEIVFGGPGMSEFEPITYEDLMAGLVGQVMRTQQPLVSPKEQPDPRESALEQERRQRLGVGSVMAAPLIYHDQTFGALLAMNRFDQPEFSDFDLDLLLAMANQAATAIETARLNEETRRRLEEVSLLSRAIALTAAAEDIPTALTDLCRELGRFFAVDRVGFALLDEDRAIANVIAEYRGPEVSSSLGIQIPVAGNPSMSYLLEQKKPLVVVDAQSDPVMGPVGEIMRQQNVSSILIVPITIADRVVGTLGLDSSTPRSFSSDEITLLERLANQVGLVLERVRLLQETRQHAASLQLINQELQDALYAKEQMIQSVSHELRTPLTLIMGYGELLIDGLMGPLTPEQEQALKTLMEQSDQLLMMVNRMLTLQTLDKSSLDKINLSLPAYLEEAQRTWQSRAIEAGLRLRLADMPPDLPTVLADPFFLNQVLDNLLDNAIKFSPRGGIIDIALDRRGSSLVVSIADQGIGIEEEIADHLFEQFFQGESGVARRFGGMGLGLALCRAIILAHEGEIWAESAGKGQGSTFYFSLPIQ